jgi:hypothetical protein
MGKRSAAGSDNLRARLAQEAARLMIEHGIKDFRLAKQKAAARFGVRERGALPSNAEIEQRLQERHRIFDPRGHESRLSGCRRVAADMMALFHELTPRLVGGVLSGSVTENTPVELHLFSDSLESIAWLLEGHGIPFRDCQRRYRTSLKQTVVYPGYSFSVEGIQVDVIAFPEKALRQAPLSPVDGRPMRRAPVREVRDLLAASSD